MVRTQRGLPSPVIIYQLIPSPRVVCSAVPLPHLQILTLICSLPHLEDLILVNFEVANEPGDGTVPQPPSSPPFTGTLEIDRPQRVGCLLHRLLSLPNGLRFRQLRCAWDVEDGFRRTISLLDACSNTLERVDLDSSPTFGESHPSASVVGPAPSLDSRLNQGIRPRF